MKFFIFALLFLTPILLFLFLNGTKPGCESFGGKWASNPGYCIKKDCYKSDACGYWANPIVWCDELKIGDTKEKVYFKLGNPIAVNNNEYIWPAGKASTSKIKAIIQDDTLQHLVCGNN